MPQNYRGSYSRGISRKEVLEEETKMVEERVMSTTMQMCAIVSQLPPNLTYYYFFPSEDSVLRPSLGKVEEIRVKTKEMEKKVCEEIRQKVEEVVEEKMREEDMNMEKGQKAIVGVDELVASVVRNYRGSGNGGESRKEVVEEKAEEVHERMMSMTV